MTAEKGKRGEEKTEIHLHAQADPEYGDPEQHYGAKRQRACDPTGGIRQKPEGQYCLHRRTAVQTMYRQKIAATERQMEKHAIFQTAEMRDPCGKESGNASGK